MIDYILLEQYSKNISVLLVEDDFKTREETSKLLLNIFSHIDIANDGVDGFNKYINYKSAHDKYYDIVIADIQMPKINGIVLTEMINSENDKQKLIILSGHNDSKYLLELVNIGITQFITKPIELDNFIKVLFDITKDIFYKNNKETNNNIIKLSANITWDKNLKKLMRDDKEIKLTKKEFLFFEFHFKFFGKIRSVEEIINYLWKDDDEISPDIKNLKNIISRLRKKVPELNIENIYGLGYKIK